MFKISLKTTQAAAPEQNAGRPQASKPLSHIALKPHLATDTTAESHMMNFPCLTDPQLNVTSVPKVGSPTFPHHRVCERPPIMTDNLIHNSFQVPLP